jgi:hypothetical protein
LLNDFFYIDLREFSDGQISALLTRMLKHHHDKTALVHHSPPFFNLDIFSDLANPTAPLSIATSQVFIAKPP